MCDNKKLSKDYNEIKNSALYKEIYQKERENIRRLNIQGDLSRLLHESKSDNNIIQSKEIWDIESENNIKNVEYKWVDVE